MRIPLSAPDITEADIDAVVEVLRTPRLSIGPRMDEFERAVADYTGTRHAVAVSSGTAGLHVSLRALGIGAGDEVILPSFTFIAAAHAVLYEQAAPVFADIDPVTLNLDPGQVEARITSRTRAILVVHTFGYPADLRPVREVAGRHGLPVIEDACEAIGAAYHGRKCGAIGRAGIFAFYPNKAITTAEGGMVVTDDDSLAEAIRALRNQGRRGDDGWFGHQLLGYNYRLSELQCALGVSQMRRLDEILERRAERARAYSQALEGVEGLILPPLEAPDGRIGWFAYVVRLNSAFTREQRDSIHEELTGRGIGCGRYFAPIHRQPLYQPYATAALPITDGVSERTLALPFFNAITDSQISEVSATLREAISRVLEAKARTASCP